MVGVAPYLNIQVEDEDSLTERFDRPQEVGMIDMAVIRVPRISNFTDFNPLEEYTGSFASLRTAPVRSQKPGCDLSSREPKHDG